MGEITTSSGYTTNRVLGDGKSYDAVFTDEKDNSTLESSDFMKLMIAQLQNQDFSNPTDTGEMLNQMTQLSNMQMMQQMASYSKLNYAMSLVGKTVTASRFTLDGTLDTTTGVIDKVSINDEEYVFEIGDKKYTLFQIMSIGADASAGESASDDSDKDQQEPVTLPENLDANVLEQ